MENILLTMRDYLDRFTSSERKVAEYIINQPDKVLLMSAQELGKACGASSAAVIRMSKTLKFSGFTEFKVQLSGQLGNQPSQPLTDISEFETLPEIKEKLNVNVKHFIDCSMTLLKDELVYEVVDLLDQSERLYVYGIGASHIVAKDIEQKFSRLGKQVSCSLDQHDMVANMALYYDKSVFIGISASGETVEVIKLLSLAKDFGLKTISLTESTDNKLSRIADISLQTAKTDMVQLRSGATLSLINHLYVSGVIYYTYLTLNYKSNINVLMQTKQATNALEELYQS